jgi:cytochrome c biogenesis protein CcmG/thiol:disulfide interchange protein DsbE
MFNRDQRLPIAALLLVAVAAVYYFGVMRGGGRDTGIDEGSKASEISIVGLDDESFVLSDLRGEVVVVEFMTTWCGVCRRQHDELVDLHERIEGTVIATVEVDPSLSEEAFEGWANSVGFDWFVGHSPVSGSTYKVTGVPTVIVVDKEGIIRHRGHYTSSADLKKIVEKYR